MPTKELVIASKAVTVRELPPQPGQSGGTDGIFIRAASRAGEARRTVSRVLHDLKYRPPRRRTAKMLVLIPAHNEEATIGRNLHALLTQTRVPDRIVVIADNCTDRTEEIARRYRGVTVMRTVGNTERKVGALNQAYLRWQAGYDYIAGVDADTVIAPDCLQRLEFEFWTADALHRKRKTYVLGGQCTLFNAEALRAVAERNRTREPWDTSTMVEDMQLTGDLQAMRYATRVSPTARAYAGPMVTVRSLWHQRRKWDEGMVRLLVSSMVNKWTATLWRQQLSMFSNGITRVVFLFLLTAALLVHQYVWSWWWAVPPVVAAALNLKLAWRVPNRTTADLIASVLLVPVEIYLVMRVACATASWVNVLAGIKRDGWANQARAEQGGSNGPVKMLGAILLVALLAAAVVLGWIHAPLFLQQRTLTVGWGALALITALQTLIMVIRIFRPSRGLRP